MKKKILIITSNPLHNGPRMIREIDALKSDFEITAVGSSGPHDSSVNYIPSAEIDFGLLDRIIRKAYVTLLNKPFLGLLPVVKKRIHRLLDDVKPNIVIIHNPIHLPYVFSYDNLKLRVVYNAHEYHPLEFEDNENWMRLYGVQYDHIYRNYLSQCHLVVNVCDGIAKKCLEEYGVKSVVVPNACSYSNVQPVVSGDSIIRVVHHGVAIRERAIEIMIHAFGKRKDNFRFDLMLVPTDTKYYEELVSCASFYQNVRLVQPVPFNKIVSFINQYDIGVFTLPPINFNYKHALPNKLFEFIQARLAIIVSPSPEMALVVKENNLGWITDDFTEDSLLRTLQRVDRSDIQQFKLNAESVARKLSAETYQEVFKTELKNLINKN